MDGYVICSNLTSNTLELQGWWCDPGALPILEDYWTYAWIAIEELTTVFKIDMAQVSKSNPVLPKSFGINSIFYDPPVSFPTTAKTYYLLYWEIGKVTFPLDAIPGEEDYNYHVLWHYSDEPPSPDNDYLLPYNQEEFDAGDGEKYLASSQYTSTGISWPMNLWRWQQWVALNRYICYSYAIRFHEMGGDPDWSEYWVVEGDASTKFYLTDEKVPPNQSNYLGGNVYNISAEFSAAIEIDSGTLGDMYYYYINLSTKYNNWKTIVQGEQPPESTPNSILTVVIGLGIVLGAIQSSIKLWNIGLIPKPQGQITVKRRKGVAANGVPQGHATNLPDGIQS